MTALFAAATAVWGSSNHRTFHEATFMELPPCTRRSASLACSKVSPSQSWPHVRPVGRPPPRVAAQRAPGERHPPIPPSSRRALRRAWRAAFQTPVRPSGNGLSSGGRPRASQSVVIPRPAVPPGGAWPPPPVARRRRPPPHPARAGGWVRGGEGRLPRYAAPWAAVPRCSCPPLPLLPSAAWRAAVASSASRLLLPSQVREPPPAPIGLRRRPVPFVRAALSVRGLRWACKAATAGHGRSPAVAARRGGAPRCASCRLSCAPAQADREPS